jgi:pyruvate formate lyase activating enzyme
MTVEERSSKRDFLKNCLLCGAGIAFGAKMSPLSSAMPNLNFDQKHSKEAMYYTKSGEKMLCDLCPNECIVLPGKAGDCRTRENHNGKLISVAYGNPCAVHSDPIEKKPLFHFLPTTRAYSISTAGCNFSCLNCQNWTISQKSPRETRNYDLMPDKVVEMCIKNNNQSIAYTYGEPIVFYEYMYDTAQKAQRKGIKNLLISCGHIKEKPLRELSKYIDAANIDLKGFNQETYKKLNGGDLNTVLQTLKILDEENVWIEITNLVVPNWTDDLKEIERMCKWLVNNNLDKYPLHFSRFMPMYKLSHLPMTTVSTLTRAREIALNAGMRYVYIGNVPGTNAESTYCPSCGKIVIERRGFHILTNNMDNGKCKSCGEKIHGVWE